MSLSPLDVDDKGILIRVIGSEEDIIALTGLELDPIHVEGLAGLWGFDLGHPWRIHSSAYYL